MITEIRNVRDILGSFAIALRRLEVAVDKEKDPPQYTEPDNLIQQIRHRLVKGKCPICNKGIVGNHDLCESCETEVPTSIRCAIDTIRRVTLW